MFALYVKPIKVIRILDGIVVLMILLVSTEGIKMIGCKRCGVWSVLHDYEKK